MKLLIINADDFGESLLINKGIKEAFKKGIVRSATIMAGKPGTQEAISFARANPQFGYGIHIDLDTSFLPKSRRAEKLKKSVTSQKVLNIIRRQIEALLKTGIQFDHIDGHHHCTMRPTLFPIFCQLAHEYGIPAIRYAPELLSRLPYVDTEFMLEWAEKYSIKHCDFFLETIVDLEKIIKLKHFTAELMIHPGYANQDVWWQNYWRQADLQFCLDANIKRFFKNKHITIGNFKDLV